MRLPRRADSDKGNAAAKPTVLLVDDHPEVLRSVSGLLAPDFDVVALVTDGYQALDVSRRANPDAVVLDITMPGLDGFQTARELRRIGSRARIVFLTMHEAEEYVAEAFRSGGQGYVLKTRVHFDLVNALDHVIAGRLFVPSLQSLFVVADGGEGHAALFYAHDRSLIDAAGGFLSTALRRGDVVSVVAAPPIRAGLAEWLQTHGWDVGKSGGHDRYHALDASAALSSIMREGRPDAARIADVVAELERALVATAEGPGTRLTLVGQLAAQLLPSGNPQAAMEIERLWNDLTHRLPFLTVCCYPIASFSDELFADLYSQLCAEHWAVGYTPVGGSRSLLS